MVNAVNRWTRTRIGQELEQCGQVCTICEVEMAVVAVVSNTHKGYKIWNWRWDLEGKRLIHFKGEVMDVYRPSSLPRMVNAVNRWTRTRIGQEGL